MRGRRLAIGQRSEVLILLPAALLLLVFVATFILFAHRSTVHSMLDERAKEAEREARRLAAELVLRPLPDGEQLRLLAPNAAAVRVRDAAGRALVAVEPFPDDRAAEEAVSGRSSLRRGGEALSVEVDLPATTLRRRERLLGWLTPLLLSVNAAVTVLALVALGRLLAPIDRLLERARRAGQMDPGSEDEIAFLLTTFDRALAALEEPSEAAELKAIEGSLARTLKSGVVLLDGSGGVLSVNARGRQILGLEAIATETAGAEVFRDHPELRELLERAARAQQEVEREELRITADGAERTIGLTAHPLRRDDDSVRGYLVIFADLTRDRQQMEERRLVESVAQLGELAAGVAHELRNGLATLRGYLSLIERRPEDGSVGDYLGEIRRESDHLQRVLEDFLTFARPGSSRPEWVDLRALGERIAADPIHDDDSVEVEAGTAGGAPHDEPVVDTVVRGDPHLLERALRNLLGNATAAHREAGRQEPVRLVLRPRDDGVEIRIEDRGEGLSERARERAFEPFFSDRSGGIGMGLAVTRRIVLLHGGRVHLEDRPGGGTRAVIWLPRADVSSDSDTSVTDRDGRATVLESSTDRSTSPAAG